MALGLTQDNRLLSLETPLGEDMLLIRSFTVTEQISGLFDMDLEMMAEVVNASKISAEKLIGQKVSIRVALSDDYSTSSHRYFHGIVSRFSQGGRDEHFVYYQAEVVPWLWLLTLTSDCRIFQDLTVPEIVTQIFDELKGSYPGLVEYRDATTAGKYTKLDYCVQYRETDFNFISRLLEQEGICYFFEHEEDRHTLVLADAPSTHQPCPNQSQVRYQPEGGTGEWESTITSWEVKQELRSGKYSLRDFHFQMPTKTLEVAEPTTINVGGNGKLELYDYPGEYAQRFNKPDQRLGEVEPEGRKLVKLRMEEEEVPYQEIQGTSYCRDFRSGYQFELTDHYDRRQEGTYLLTTVQHSAVQSPDYLSEGEASEAPYYNSFTCIPEAIPFRPPRVTPKPVVQGLQSAVVVGKKGEEIWTDKYGRVRVQFHWDRKGKRDEQSTCWVRVAQPWAGKQWGAIFLPRIGQEVVVAFLEGDPDQPLVVGSVYNAENMPPYELPANQTQSGIKTRSSKGGGASNFNELRFEDKKGSEHIYFHAEKDFLRLVENDDKLAVGHDQTIVIKNNRTETVKEGDETVTIEQGNRTVSIDTGNETLQVKQGDRLVSVDMGNDTHQIKQGNRDVQIDMGNDTLTIKMGNQTTKLNLGKSSTEAMQSIELKVGTNSIKIDQTGITLKGLMIKIEGQMMTQMKGMMTQVNGNAMLQLKGGITMIG